MIPLEQVDASLPPGSEETVILVYNYFQRNHNDNQGQPTQRHRETDGRMNGRRIPYSIIALCTTSRPVVRIEIFHLKNFFFTSIQTSPKSYDERIHLPV